MEILTKIILIGAFLVMFLNISGIRELLQIRANRFFHKLLSCDFCLSWWASLTLSVVFALLIRDYQILLDSVLATPVIYFLLR